MSESMSDFDLTRFIDDVFAPEPGETVLLMVDEPTADHDPNSDWIARREMAARWMDGFCALGAERDFEVLPVLHFPAIDHHNGEFPEHGSLDGEAVEILPLLNRVSLTIAMTEVSMTAALMQISRQRPGAAAFRAASAPLARRDMEDTCLNIDYAQLKARCAEIEATLARSHRAEVQFTTGHRCEFDLRHRSCGNDNGYLHRDKKGPPLVNLPSGEVWVVPYEGEIEGDPSTTAGQIPVALYDDSVAVLDIEANRVVHVGGDEPARGYYRSMLEVDPMRRNVAEIAFGCNPGARVSGLYIEDEKAGFHWGLGRSEFLGGTVGPEAFRDLSTILHHDMPYARQSPITVSAQLLLDDGSRVGILDKGQYLI